MIKRFLAAILGGAIFGVLLPLSYALLIGMPDSLMGLLWLVSIGGVIGVILGASLPKAFGFTFGFIFEAILGV